MVIVVNELAGVYRPATRDDLNTVRTNIVLFHDCCKTLVILPTMFAVFTNFTFNCLSLNSSLECCARGEG